MFCSISLLLMWKTINVVFRKHFNSKTTVSWIIWLIPTFIPLIAVTTEIKHLCPGDSLCIHVPISSCIDVPPTNVDQTLVLALPFLPAITGFEEDLLCPVHPPPGERCVDLFSCNRFRGSAYASSITICRKLNNASKLEMCFQNFTEKLNGTKAHFFYSILHCLRPSRVYIKSIKFIVDSELFSIIIIICMLTNRFLCSL